VHQLAITMESTLEAMLTKLRILCPCLGPAIFSSQHPVKSVLHLAVDKEQQDQAREWQAALPSPFLGFSTDVDLPTRTIRIVKICAMSELDATLCDLEQMMRLVVLGEGAQLEVAMSRFLEVNGYSGDLTTERHIFSDTYNLAYAIKVLLSSVPMHLSLGNTLLPLTKDASLEILLSSLLVESMGDNTGTAARNGDNDKTQKKDVDFDAENNADSTEAKKKRKRRRGGG